MSDELPPSGALAPEPASPAPVDDDAGSPRGPGSWVLEILRTWGPAILAIILIRTFVFQPFNIPSTSMVPTLLIGDHVIVTKFSYGLWFPNPLNYDRYELLDYADPQRGDVIVFRYPLQKSLHYIKRVVALPGDTIEVRDNQIVINGKVQPREPVGRYQYFDDNCGTAKVAELWQEHLGPTAHAKLTDLDQHSGLAWNGPVTVPPGKVFAMGDNRDNSGDSRQWGFVDEELIMGRAQFIWISFDNCGTGFPPPFRWDRIGQGLYSPVAPNL